MWNANTHGGFGRKFGQKHPPLLRVCVVSQKKIHLSMSDQLKQRVSIDKSNVKAADPIYGKSGSKSKSKLL